MIQDDFGNLVHTPVSGSIFARLEEGDARMTRIEQDLAANTAATKKTADSTSELVELLQAFKGGFRALEYLGKLARPLGYILKVCVAIAAIWATYKTGGQGQ